MQPSQRCRSVSRAGSMPYLKDFPFGCSEQITSGAFCRLTLIDETDFGLSRAEINKQLERTFGVLARRQNDQGGFGYWVPGDRRFNQLRLGICDGFFE